MKTESPPLVVHIIYSLGTGGLENGLINIINRSPLGKYRHAIICLTTAQDFANRITSPDVQIVELNKNPGHDPALYWRLWKVLRGMNPSIIHSRNLAALETQWLGVFMPRVKRVHGEHGRDMHDLDGSNWKYRILRKIMSPLIHRYIAVSRDLADWLTRSVAIQPSRIEQIYNGVDQQRFIRKITNKRRVLPEGFLPEGDCIVLGTVGRFAEVKNQMSILEALAILFKKSPDLLCRVRLVLVGDGSLMDQIVKRVDDLGLGDIVWLPGDRDNIPQLLQAMDIFILPSLGEGISNTVLEAMATGLPVIATAVGGNPELVRPDESGLLVPVDDVPALVSAIQELIESPSKRKAMGDMALARIKSDFDWNRTVKQYIAIYDSLLLQPTG